jgi:hypothetical protein
MCIWLRANADEILLRMLIGQTLMMCFTLT